MQTLEAILGTLRAIPGAAADGADGHCTDHEVHSFEIHSAADAAPHARDPGDPAAREGRAS